MLPQLPTGQKVGVKHELGPPRFIVNLPSVGTGLHFEKQFYTFPEEFKFIPVDEYGRVHTLRNLDPIDTGDVRPWNSPHPSGFLRIQTLPRFRLKFVYKFRGLSLYETRYPEEYSPPGYSLGEFEFLVFLWSNAYLFTNVWSGNSLHLIPHSPVVGSEYDNAFPVRPVGKFEPRYIQNTYLPYYGHLRSSYEIEVTFETLQTYDHIPAKLIGEGI